MTLGMTIDELLLRIDPFSYWSYASTCRICGERSVGYVTTGNGLCRVDICDKHAHELALIIMSPIRHCADTPQGSLLHLAAHMDAFSFFPYTGKCDVIRPNMQACGRDSVGCFAAVDGKQVKACHACSCKILYMLSKEQPELWLNPNARARHHIIKAMEKWSTYERILQLVPPLC